MKTVFLVCSLLLAACSFADDGSASKTGVASWYGEAHRGKAMANRQPFDPDQLTAASWFYPLGTRVRVSLRSQPERSVVVTITDRGPAKRLVRQGRIIDLAHAAFEKIAHPDLGLTRVTVETVE